mgnify:CR=1 FL=1
MTPDMNTIETLVEIITREVLLAMIEEEEKNKNPQGATCVVEVANGVKVKTCFDNAGHVVSAGAERLTSTVGVIPEDRSLASMIDHTLLKPDATSDKIAQLCFEARKYHFASVCVNPTHVKLCADLLRDSDVKVCTVIGFPLGATSPEVKAFEARNALENGATEIDMVINIGALKAGETELVARDIRGVVEVAHAANALVKVIIETALLTSWAFDSANFFGAKYTLSSIPTRMCPPSARVASMMGICALPTPKALQLAPGGSSPFKYTRFSIVAAVPPAAPRTS